MRIGVVSSWNERCGISEYTKNLVSGLLGCGIEVKVAANYPKDQVEPDEPFVKRFFHCPFLTKLLSADVVEMVDYLSDCDVIHIQFETSLYHPDWFPKFLVALKIIHKKVVFTMHSSGMWNGFPVGLINWFITHEAMWCGGSVIPMGVKFSEDVEPDYKSIVSFGLGRNMDDMVKNAIEGTDITFRTTYGHHNWLNANDLVAEIKKSWIISLLYPSVGTTNVSSSAVIQAMGCNRPILITNTSWFKHVINYPNLYICESLESLKENIKYLTDPKNKEVIKEDIKLMKDRIISDGRSFDDFINRHIEVYTSLV